MNHNGCPLQGTKFGYCSSCAQNQSCLFLHILEKLEDLEKKANAFS
jgi:hypothetical protein